MVPGVYSALGTIIPLAPSEILGSRERGFSAWEWQVPNEGGFAPGAVEEWSGLGSRVGKARLRPRGRGHRPEMATRVKDSDSAHPSDRPRRAGTGFDSFRHPQNQVQDTAGQRDSGSICWLETIDDLAFCTCLGTSQLYFCDFLIPS